MKKTLSLVLAVLMIFSVMFCVPFTASAADVNAYSQTYKVSDFSDLADALRLANSGTTIMLTSNISETIGYNSAIVLQSYAQYPGGAVVLDLNGYYLDVSSDKMTSLFALTEATQFYIIDSDPRTNYLNFNSKKSTSSGDGCVIEIDNKNASLYTSGVQISYCKADAYRSTDTWYQTCVINCKDFSRINLNESTLTNYACNGAGIKFRPANSTSYDNSELRVLSSTIKSKIYCIDYDSSYDWAKMLFDRSTLDCEESLYQAFDLPSGCDALFGNIAGSLAFNLATVSQIPTYYKVAEYTEKCDIQFVNQTTCSHTVSTLVNTPSGHYKICTKCGIFTDCESHSGKKAAVAPTCLASGHTGGYDCSVCGYFSIKTVDALKHKNAVDKPAVAANCNTWGYTAGQYCPDCDTWVSGHSMIPPTGHTYDNDDDLTCNICGLTRATAEHSMAGYTLVWSESFEDSATALPAGWEAIDKDGDGFNWKITAQTDGNYKIHHGNNTLYSESYDNGNSQALTPENWLILPEQTLAKCKAYKLTFTYISQDADYFETFGVYLSTDGGKTYKQLGSDYRTESDYMEAIVDLSAYAGQKVKVAVVHYKSTDNFRVNLDCFHLWSKDLAHDYKTTTTPATTTKDGKIVVACTSCGVSKTTVIPKASNITISATKYVYDGKVKNPTVTVKDSKGQKLVKGTDYTLTASSGRKNVGQYTVKVTLTGKYSGTKSFTMYVLPGATSKISATSSTSAIKLSWKAVPGAAGYRIYYYNTSTKKYTKLKDTTATSYTVSKLKSGTDYKFAVKAYGKSGSTVYWSDSYKTLTMTTKPGTPTLKATAGTKKATLSWNKQTGADGYVLYMATSKNGTYTRIAVLKGNSKVSFTKTGLTKGKTYYFKVAAYSTVGSTTVYGACSAVQSCKVK